MKNVVASAIFLALMAAAPAHAQGVQVSPNGSRPSTMGSAQFFTGNVVVDPLFGETKHSRTTGGHVTFAPGARSHWHTHPAGQILIITSGVGWVQEEGGEKREVRPGDVVSIPPGVRHWHGASATNGMRHIAIQDMVDGQNVDWREPVTDQQYGK